MQKKSQFYVDYLLEKIYYRLYEILIIMHLYKFGKETGGNTFA